MYLTSVRAKLQNRQVMFGRVPSSKAKLNWLKVRSRAISGKADQNFAGSGKPLLIREPRSRIDNVNAKSRLARERRHRHAT
jgi:hypothetical protein